MIGAPVRNRAWALPRYFMALQAAIVGIPPVDDLLFRFVLNDSTDDTEDVLRKFAADEPAIIVRHDLGGRATGSEERGAYSFANLAELRNVLLEQFLASDADYLLSVDTDVLMPERSIARLMAHNVDIVAALVNNGGNDDRPAWNLMRSDPSRPGRFERIWDPPNDGLIPVDLTGACILIHRRVIEAGVRYSHHPQGEDGGFCMAAQAKGFSIWADCGIRCQHLMAKEGGE